MIPSSTVLGFEFSGGLPPWQEQSFTPSGYEQLFMHFGYYDEEKDCSARFDKCEKPKKKPKMEEVTVIGHRYPISMSFPSFGCGGGSAGVHPMGVGVSWEASITTGERPNKKQCSATAIKALNNRCLSKGISAAGSVYRGCRNPNMPGVAVNAGYDFLVSLGLTLDVANGAQKAEVCYKDFQVPTVEVRAACGDKATQKKLSCES